MDGLDWTLISDIGRVYAHNDLPFLPQCSIPRGSKVKKLRAIFEKKTKYLIHYRNLQQAIKNGLIVEKVNILFFNYSMDYIHFLFLQVHRVLEFKQSACLAEYISMNTELRKKAKNDFDKDFFKLMNNAIFGMLLYTC